MNTLFIRGKDKATVKRVIRSAMRLLQRIRAPLPGYHSSVDPRSTAARERRSTEEVAGGSPGATHRQGTEDEALAILGEELLKENRELGEKSIRFESLLEEGDYEGRDGNENSDG